MQGIWTSKETKTSWIRHYKQPAWWTVVWVGWAYKARTNHQLKQKKYLLGVRNWNASWFLFWVHLWEQYSYLLIKKKGWPQKPSGPCHNASVYSQYITFEQGQIQLRPCEKVFPWVGVRLWFFHWILYYLVIAVVEVSALSYLMKTSTLYVQIAIFSMNVDAKFWWGLIVKIQFLFDKQKIFWYT